MEIEYKALTLAGKWVFGSYVKQIDENGYVTHWMIPFDTINGVEIRFETLCLYSNRRDFDNNKIYQNDIIGRPDGTAALVVYTPTMGFFLRWGDGRKRATFSHVGDGFFIVGNICENSESNLVDTVKRWGKSYYKQKEKQDDISCIIG